MKLSLFFTCVGLMLLLGFNSGATTPEEKGEEAATEACFRGKCPFNLTPLALSEKPQAEVDRMADEIVGKGETGSVKSKATK